MVVVDGDGVALEHVDQVVRAAVEGVLLADLHREHARDPVVVLLEDLVAARRHVEGRDVALDVAARLADELLAGSKVKRRAVVVFGLCRWDEHVREREG